MGREAPALLPRAVDAHPWRCPRLWMGPAGSCTLTYCSQILIKHICSTTDSLFYVQLKSFQLFPNQKISVVSQGITLYQYNTVLCEQLHARPQLLPGPPGLSFVVWHDIPNQHSDQHSSPCVCRNREVVLSYLCCSIKCKTNGRNAHVLKILQGINSVRRHQKCRPSSRASILCSSTVQRIKKGLHIPPNSINETTNSKSCHTELKNKYTEKNQLQTDNKTQFSLQQLMDTNGEWGNKTNKIITILKKKKKKRK